MERAAKGDHARPAGGDARDLHGILAGLGPGGDEDGLLRKITGHQGVQTLCQPDVGLIGQDLMAGMGEFGHLAGDRRHHLGVAVPGIDHGDAGGKIDVAVALDIPDFAVERAIGIDLRHHPDTPGNGIVAAAGNFGVQHVRLPQSRDLQVRRRVCVPI